MTNRNGQHYKKSLAFQKWGSGEEPVVCIHGWQDNSNSFLPMSSELYNTQQKMTWFAIDLPGHGQSPWKGDDAYYHFVDYVYDLKLFLDEHQLETCHLIGHSMGGMIANLFAALYPERVTSLNLIEGVGLLYQQEGSAREQMLSSFRSRDKADLNTATRYFESLKDLAELRCRVSDFDYPISELIMRRNARQLSKDKWQFLIDPKLKQLSALRVSQSQAMELLNNLDIPTTLILGERGYTMAKAGLNNFRPCFNQLSIQTISGGHHCHMEQPKDCFEIINNSISNIAALKL